MAQQTINNGESYGSIRTKLNTMFSEIYASLASIGTSITSLTSSNTTINTTLTSHTASLASNATSITSLNAGVASLQSVDTSHASRLSAIEALDVTQNSRITAAEAIGVTQVTAILPLPAASITVVPTLLTFFDTISLQVKSFSTATILSQSVTINTAGIYKITGNIILEFPQTDQISIQLYKNGIAATPSFHQQGLGVGKPVNIGYSSCMSLLAADVLTLYATSLTGTFSCIIDGGSVLVEKTHF